MRTRTKNAVVLLLCLCASWASAWHPASYYYTPDYLALKKRIIEEFAHTPPGKFSEFIRRRRPDGGSGQKVLALTFDACDARRHGYNKALIDYLRAEKIPATIFVTGLWIDANRQAFMELAKDPLFEIEDHGLQHRVCSVTGRGMYGVRATKGLGGVIDEMELNARKIQELTGRRPVFFRSATAYTDELSRKVAQRLGMEVVSYDVLSGDAMHESAQQMSRNLINGAREGAIVIMHANHPDWPEVQALKLAVPVLRKRGYTFARLDSFTLH